MTPLSLAEKPTQAQIENTRKEGLDKAERKSELFKSLSWDNSKKTLLACITYPLTEKNNVGLIHEIMPGLLEQNLKLVLMGIGTEKYQNYFMQLARDHSDQIVILEESEVNKDDLYAAADVLLCPSDSPEAQEAVQSALVNGVVPITLNQLGLIDYDPVQEKGNAFIFEKLSSWSLFASIVRALENFKFPYDWKNIQKGN